MTWSTPSDRAAQDARRARARPARATADATRCACCASDGRRVLCEVHADAVEYKGDIASTGTLRDVTEERRQPARAGGGRAHATASCSSDSPVGLFRTRPRRRDPGGEPGVGAACSATTIAEQLQGRRSPTCCDVYADPAEREALVERAAADGALRAPRDAQCATRDGNADLGRASACALTRDEDDATAQFAGSALDIDRAPRRCSRRCSSSENKYRKLVEHSQVGVYMMRRRPLHLRQRGVRATCSASPRRSWSARPTASCWRRRRCARLRRLRRADRTQPANLPPEYESCLLHADGQRVHVTGQRLAGRRSTASSHADRHDASTSRGSARPSSGCASTPTHDPLTGLPNRLLFHQQLAER